MLIRAGAIKTFEMALNRYITLDPEHARLFKPLQGKILCLHLKKIDSNLYFFFVDNYIQIKPTTSEQVDATLSATPLALVRYFSDKTHQFEHRDIDIAGNIDFIQKLQIFLSLLQVDWEEQLALLTNDQIAYQTTKLLKIAASRAKSTRELLTNQIRDYITAESTMIVAREQLDQFCKEVDDIRIAVDRLTAKIHLYTQKIIP